MFNSPTYGSLSLSAVRRKVLEFMGNSPDCKYHLVIGTDSQPKNGKGCDFITAIIVHKVGAGGIYFWKRVIFEQNMILRHRIYQEAVLSLECADELLRVFKNDGITKYDLEIHVDIGKYGETREMLSEVIGMIRGSGFAVKVKPDSYGASKVADRHT